MVHSLIHFSSHSFISLPSFHNCLLCAKRGVSLLGRSQHACPYEDSYLQLPWVPAMTSSYFHQRRWVPGGLGWHSEWQGVCPEAASWKLQLPVRDQVDPLAPTYKSLGL